MWDHHRANSTISMYLAFAAMTSQYAFSLENKSPEKTKQLLDVVKKNCIWQQILQYLIISYIGLIAYCLHPRHLTR